MKIFEADKIREIDRKTVEDRKISSTELMEEAAFSIFKIIIKSWSINTRISVWAGSGNNGGDGLVIARLLISKGYKVEIYLWNPNNKLSEDCRTNLSRLDKSLVHEISREFSGNEFNLPKSDLYIDSLFGSGLNRPIEGTLGQLIKHINKSNIDVVSIDIPSGLMLKDNTDIIVKAKYTISIDRPKLQFFFPENHKYIGNLLISPLKLSQLAIDNTKSNYHLTTVSEIKKIFKPRSLFDHKGKFGHLLIIAGSRGMSGASILSAKGALRSGVGLLSLATPSCNRLIVQTASPEAMLIELGENNIFDINKENSLNFNKYRTLVIGPGLGQTSQGFLSFKKLLQQIKQSIILDADGINYFSQLSEKEQVLPEGSIITPHLKELERIIGKVSNHYERIQKTIDLCKRLNSYVVIKGKYSVIVAPDGNCYFNPTGNPGMATGGSGDVLSGILGSLLSQGYSSLESAIFGVYLHGKAGDLAKEKYGETALIASDIVDNLSVVLANIENNKVCRNLIS